MDHSVALQFRSSKIQKMTTEMLSYWMKKLMPIVLVCNRKIFQLLSQNFQCLPKNALQSRLLPALLHRLESPLRRRYARDANLPHSARYALSLSPTRKSSWRRKSSTRSTPSSRRLRQYLLAPTWNSSRNGRRISMLSWAKHSKSSSPLSSPILLLGARWVLKVVVSLSITSL